MSRQPGAFGLRARLEPHALRGYLGAVAVIGTALLAALWALQGLHTIREDVGVFALLAAFVVVGELVPIRLPGHDGEVVTSTTFTLAILILFGPAPAIAVQAVASLLGDARLGKSVAAAGFNVGQYAISLGMAALVLDLLLGVSATMGLGGPDAVALMAAGAVFYVCNNVLAGTAGALAERARVRVFLMEDLRFQATTAVMLLGFTPLIVATADEGVLFVALLAFPLVAIYRAGKEGRLNEHHALHDRLTDLPNRVLFARRAEEAIASAAVRGGDVAVMLMDLDRFKDINDTLGHHRGDELLRHVGPRLLDGLRKQDVVARFGGDEFAMLLPGIDGRGSAERVARRALESLRRSFEMDGIVLDVDASIGIACYPNDGDEVDTLLRHADVAMYSAKEHHLGVAHYDAERDDRTLDRLALVTEMRQALDDETFLLHFQPQIDLATGAVTSAEALVRWEHPTRGLLLPKTFLPVLEQTTLLQPVTAYVMDRAIRHCVEWRRHGIAAGVSVNVTARDILGDGLVERIEDMLRRHGLPASELELEITESVIMTDPDRAVRALERVRAIGVRVAIDDFGTGYSSLAYLKNLPVDVLKIDRSFVFGMADDPNDAIIVASTINLARGLRLACVAEGIEDEASLAQLAAQGCDRAQGYHISRPMPAEDFLRWAAAYRPSPVAA